MTTSKRFTIIAAAAAVGIAGWAVVHRTAAATDPAASAPTTAEADAAAPMASVKTATIQIGDVSRTITAYGSVAARPGGTVIQSLSTDVRVVQLSVAPGQSVKKGDPLIEVEGSPDAKFQFLDASNALEAAKRNLADTQERLNLKLATNSEILTAQQALQSAQAKVDNLQKRGAGAGNRTINADADALVTKVDAQAGQLVTAGGALVELLPRDHIEISLGVEPSEAGALRVAQPVSITSAVGVTDPIDAKVRAIAQQIDPISRLIAVYVTPDADQSLLLDSFATGEFELPSLHGMVVPREAVLPADEGFTVFTVKDGKAVKHAVTVPVQNDHDAIINGADLHKGDVVVTEGNLELEDGAAVKAEADDTAAGTPEGDK